APNDQERLKRVWEIKWVRQLPKARRDQLQTVQGAEREALIKRWREEERQQREEWRTAMRRWDEVVRKPTRLADFPPAIQVFVRDYLRPRLSPGEQERLDQAEDTPWPGFGRTFVELADMYPLALPARRLPSHFRDLP